MSLPRQYEQPPMQPGENFLERVTQADWMNAAGQDLDNAYAHLQNRPGIPMDGTGGLAPGVEVFVGKVTTATDPGDEFTPTDYGCYWVMPQRVLTYAGNVYKGEVSDENIPTYGLTVVKVPAVNVAEAIKQTRILPTDGSVGVLVVGLPARDTGIVRYVFYALPAPTTLIPVTLSADGGADGNATTAPTYTYKWPVNVVTGSEIYDHTGGLITGLSPAWARSIGSFARGTHGTGYLNAAGDFVLWQVDEVPNAGQRSCA